MKKVALVGGLAIFLAVFSGVRSVHAQDNPASWIFYLAFEDAVGARDTLWEVWHTDGTIHADMNLGEVPIILDSTSMNVWTYVYNNPDDYFDHHVVHFWGSTFEIYANNYVLPLTVTWDTALFHADVLFEVTGYGVNHARLENEWTPLETGFNMLETDHVELPWFWWGDQSHFPLMVYIQRGPLGLSTEDVVRPEVELFPNPATDHFRVSAPGVHGAEVYVHDLSGRVLYRGVMTGENLRIPTSGFAPGLYLVYIRTDRGTAVGKVVVRENR